MSEVETVTVIPTDPKVKAAIRESIRTISDQWALIEGHRAVIKSEVDAIAETHDLPKKHVRRMARVYHNQNFKTDQEENEEFALLYEAIVEKAKDKPTE